MLDRVEEIREVELPGLREQKEEIRQRASDYEYASQIPQELENEYEQVNAQIDDLEGEANTLEYYAEEWGDDVFVIRELTVGQVGMIQDDVAEASEVDFRGGGTPKQGYARRRSLEVAIKDQPNGAPSPEEFPDAVGDWLFECIDSFNSRGEVKMGNSSLRAEMARGKFKNS